jgi:hypothetical protein
MPSAALSPEISAQPECPESSADHSDDAFGMQHLPKMAAWRRLHQARLLAQVIRHKAIADQRAIAVAGRIHVASTDTRK